MPSWPSYAQAIVRALLGNAAGPIDATNPLDVTVTGSVPLAGGGIPIAGSLAVTVAAARLSTNQVCKGVTVQADPDNASDVLVGDNNAQTVQLTPGQMVFLAVSNVNLLYGRTASGTGYINWLVVA